VEHAGRRNDEEGSMQVKLLAASFVATTCWGLWVRATGQLRAMAVAVRERRLLAEMSDRELRDIGITRSEARAEAARWPWDL
jgi:uncharacterized protein YjiS (DUF1127 family)